MTSDSRFWQLNKIFYIRNRNDVLFQNEKDAAKQSQSNKVSETLDIN